jgi:hypothetical protein
VKSKKPPQSQLFEQMAQDVLMKKAKEAFSGLVEMMSTKRHSGIIYLSGFLLFIYAVVSINIW